jgi:hypothetical protein
MGLLLDIHGRCRAGVPDRRSGIRHAGQHRHVVPAARQLRGRDLRSALAGHPAEPVLRAHLRRAALGHRARVRGRAGLVRGPRPAREPAGEPADGPGCARRRPRGDPPAPLGGHLRRAAGRHEDRGDVRPDRPRGPRRPAAVHRRGLLAEPAGDAHVVRRVLRRAALRGPVPRRAGARARGPVELPAGHRVRRRPGLLHHLHVGLERSPQGRRDQPVEHLQLHRHRAVPVRGRAHRPRLPGHDDRVRLLHRGDLADLGGRGDARRRPHRRPPGRVGAGRLPRGQRDHDDLLRPHRAGDPRPHPAADPHGQRRRRGLPPRAGRPLGTRPPHPQHLRAHRDDRDLHDGRAPAGQAGHHRPPPAASRASASTAPATSVASCPTASWSTWAARTARSRSGATGWTCRRSRASSSSTPR